MSAVQTAVAEVLRLQEIERQAFAALGADDEAPEMLAAITVSRETDAAVLELLALPADNGTQAAAKLSIAAAHYDLSAGGLPDRAVGMLVAECVRFLAAGHMTMEAAA